MIHLHVAYFFAMFTKIVIIFLFFLMEFTLQAPFGIIFLQKILHRSVLCEEIPPRITFFSNFHPQYQLAGPFSWFSADRLHAGWCSAGCFSSFWLPKVVYQAPKAKFRSTPRRAQFSHRFLDFVLDVFFMDVGSIFDDFSDDFSIDFQSFFWDIFLNAFWKLFFRIFSFFDFLRFRRTLADTYSTAWI